MNLKARLGADMVGMRRNQKGWRHVLAGGHMPLSLLGAMADDFFQGDVTKETK